MALNWGLRALDRIWRALGWHEPPAAEFVRRYRRLHTELQAYVDDQQSTPSGARRGD